MVDLTSICLSGGDGGDGDDGDGDGDEVREERNIITRGRTCATSREDHNKNQI